MSRALTLSAVVVDTVGAAVDVKPYSQVTITIGDSTNKSLGGGNADIEVSTDNGVNYDVYARLKEPGALIFFNTSTEIKVRVDLNSSTTPALTCAVITTAVP